MKRDSCCWRTDNRFHSEWYNLVFTNGAMLSVSDKYDSVNKCTQEISELMKLHIQEVWQNARLFIRQLADCWAH